MKLKFIFTVTSFSPDFSTYAKLTTLTFALSAAEVCLGLPREKENFIRAWIMLFTKREQNRNNSSVFLACENVWETLGVAGRMWGPHRNDKNRKDSVLYIAFIWIVVWKHHFKSPYLSCTVSQKIVVNLSDYIWPQHIICKVNSDLLLHRTSCALTPSGCRRAHSLCCARAAQQKSNQRRSLQADESSCQP